MENIENTIEILTAGKWKEDGCNGCTAQHADYLIDISRHHTRLCASCYLRLIAHMVKAAKIDSLISLCSDPRKMIPLDPAKAYPDQWKGWNDFLGLEGDARVCDRCGQS